MIETLTEADMMSCMVEHHSKDTFLTDNTYCSNLTTGIRLIMRKLKLLNAMKPDLKKTKKKNNSLLYSDKRIDF